ncbi:hypothetical protein [Botrimarina colliarenosi]|nr:hypothetical protein [Botrimarina colliarenosi]
METDPSSWRNYAAISLTLKSSLCALIFSAVALKGSRVRWWKRLLSGVGCFFVEAGILIAYQCGRVEGASFKAWLPRVLVGLTAIALALASDWSGWQSRSEWARDSMVGAVYLLSADAASSEGSIIYTMDGNAGEITGRWNSAVFLGAYGVALGALFLRNTLNAAIALGWLGAMTGVILSVRFFAWSLDSLDNDVSRLHYSLSYYLHFHGPTLLAPWVALVVLILTTRATSSDPVQDATP